MCDDAINAIVKSIDNLINMVREDLEYETNRRMLYDVTVVDLLIEKGIITEDEYKKRCVVNSEVLRKVIQNQKDKEQQV